MLKHDYYGNKTGGTFQPPSGGCVLKRSKGRTVPAGPIQPPSGGCVLKLPGCRLPEIKIRQPPSGGCVLKPNVTEMINAGAASRLRAAVC